MIRRVKDVVTNIGSGTTPKSGEPRYYDNANIPWLNSGDLNNGIVNSTAKCITPDALTDYPTLRFYSKGCVVVAMYGASIGKTGLLDIDTTVNQACCVLLPNLKHITPSYLHLLLQLSKERFLIESFGGTQPNISQKIVANLLIEVPSLREQELQTAYLDKECEKIGRQIELLERKADAYKRLRRSIINRAVTRGLNLQAPMKPSGSSLTDKIPAHWDERRIKDVFTEVSIKGFPNEPMLCATQSRGVIPQSMYENRVVAALTGLENMKLVEPGNFVISLRSFQGGIEYAYYRGIISAAYTILRIDGDNSKDFFKHFFKSPTLIKLMKKCVTGIREGQNINYTVLKYENVPLPPYIEQQQIAAYLDEKCSKIDAFIEKIATKIERLRELKRSLINEVVTGKRAINYILR